MAVVDVNRVLALEAELSAVSEQLADLERNAAWHGQFNVRTALRSIARAMDDAEPLREALALATKDCEEGARVVATLQAAFARGLAPLRRFSSQHLTNRQALDDALAKQVRLQKRVDECALQLKAVYGDITRVEAELERYRAFDFPGSVRRRMKLEDRVAWLRAELVRVQGRGLSLAPV